MKNQRKIIVALLAAVALGAGPALAYKGGDCGPMGYGMPDGPKAERMKERMQKRLEARQEQLHKELKLSAAQEPAWRAYTEKSGPPLDWKFPDREAMDKGFLILSDWAHAVSFDPEEIDKERGVIMEEYRGTLSAWERCYRKINQTFYQGSRYADRMPIGDPEIIQHAPY